MTQNNKIFEVKWKREIPSKLFVGTNLHRGLLRGHNFDIFWPPPSLRGQKQTFLDPLPPPPSCPRSYWMSPWYKIEYMILLIQSLSFKISNLFNLGSLKDFCKIQVKYKATLKNCRKCMRCRVSEMLAWQEKALFFASNDPRKVILKGKKFEWIFNADR